MWLFKLQLEQNMQVNVSECAKSTEQSSVSTYGQDLDFTSIPEESNQHTTDGGCKVAQWGSVA